MFTQNKTAFDLQFPRTEFKIIMRFLRKLENKSIDVHIASMKTGHDMIRTAQDECNNGNFEQAYIIFEEAWEEYFWDAFNAIDCLIPRDLVTNWEKMKEDIDNIDLRLSNHIYWTKW